MKKTTHVSRMIISRRNSLWAHIDVTGNKYLPKNQMRIGLAIMFLGSACATAATPLFLRKFLLPVSSRSLAFATLPLRTRCETKSLEPQPERIYITSRVASTQVHLLSIFTLASPDTTHSITCLQV